jgi:hypothetical protein
MDIPNGENLATCEHFKIAKKSLVAGMSIANPIVGKFSVLSVVEGELESRQGRRFSKGTFVLLPRDAAPLRAIGNSIVLQVTLP